MQTKIYLAYGSNLNKDQMASRCPQATALGPTMLANYQLVFRGGHHSAVATIEPQQGTQVAGLLWRITATDEEALDRYEGWPVLYRKETVKVRLNKRVVKAMVYILNEGYPLGLASAYYYKTILQGYLDCGFDPALLKQAMEACNQEGEWDD